MSEERTLRAESGGGSESIEAEIATLELAFADIAPLGKGDGLSVMGGYRQRVAVHEILRQDIESGQARFVRLIQIQIVGKDLQHVRATLRDVVHEEFYP